MNPLIRTNPLITLPIGAGLLVFSSAYIDTFAIPLLVLLQLLGFTGLWLSVAQLFERFPFRFNRTKEQHMHWMGLVQYAVVCVCGAVMLWQDPQRFDWLVNGSRFYVTLTVANIAYYIVDTVAIAYYLDGRRAPDKVFHHMSYAVLLSIALLLGHWEYIFVWVGFLSLLYGLPFKVMLILKASAHRQTYLWYLIQYGAWVLLRVGVFGALMLYYFVGIDKSALPTSFFWTIYVPFTFLVSAVLGIYWAVDMSRVASKTWRRRFGRQGSMAPLRQ